MIKSTNYLRVFAGICLILLLASNCWCQDLSSSVVKIYFDGVYICAGTLVRDNFVVTLASCFESKHETLGLHVVGNIQKVGLAPNGVSSVVKIFTPKYNIKQTGYMDVAVLKLEKPISELGIKPAELCSQTSIESETPLTLYYWHSDRTLAHLMDILELTARPLRAVIIFRNSKFSDSVLYAVDRQKSTSVFDKGGPIEIAEKCCAICQHDASMTDDSALVPLTSLASTHVRKFIEESLAK